LRIIRHVAPRREAALERPAINLHHPVSLSLSKGCFLLRAALRNLKKKDGR
jgi:hypothetical protein